jgi:hypothetical protein
MHHGLGVVGVGLGWEEDGGLSEFKAFLEDDFLDVCPREFDLELI